MGELVQTTRQGLVCSAGGFAVDPWQPSGISCAIITHAHSDHARVGASGYITAKSGVEVLKARLGSDINVQGLAFGETLRLGDCVVSLHPAGHVLGSAMVRIERVAGGSREVWVVSGDYKTETDCSGEQMQPLSCDTFISESTFGLPVYRWRPRAQILAQVNQWWSENAAEGVTSIVYAYALGKAQSVLAGLDASIGKVLVHGAVEKFVPIYEAAGVTLPRCERATQEAVRNAPGAIVIAPPGAENGAWARALAKKRLVREAFASGWMQARGPRRRRGVDKGFVLSDHADWNGLLATIKATGASNVGVTHGFTSVLARALREQGLQSWELGAEYEGDEAEYVEAKASGKLGSGETAPYIQDAAAHDDDKSEESS
jgi:putative mRNA 3-end processing factor